MIRSAIMILAIFIMFLMTGANYKNADTQEPKKHCMGYSVIAADKGIDCNGDTIRLIKVNGYFERANRERI
jgi:hypothetical protein